MALAGRWAVLGAVLLAAVMAAGVASAEGPAHYYIAAEEVEWDYAPSGRNLCKDEALMPEMASTKFRKAAFVEYTDETFKVKKPKAAGLEHTGLLGPVLRAAVGDSLGVTLLNRLPFPVNIVPSGLLAEGGGDASAVPAAEPNGTAAYRWAVPAAAAPPAGEPGAKFWLYRSGVDLSAHANAGLLGGVLVSAAGADSGNSSSNSSSGAAAAAAAAQQDVITVFQVIDEGSSPFSEHNSVAAGGDGEEGSASMHWHAINGYVFCNMPEPQLHQGETVRWHVAAVGAHTEIHNAHWHGNTFLAGGRRADQVKLLPGSVQSVAMGAEAPGRWLLHCHVNDHMHTGMVAMYAVLPGNATADEAAPLPAGGSVRRYFVAAEEVEWDYTPYGANMCDGTKYGTPFSDAEFTFVANTSTRVGRRFTKARYVQYSDASFATRVPRSAADESLGLLGPVLRAAVGDRLEVVFKNQLRYPASMHPHGVRYAKDSEGSPYADGTTGADRADDAVPTGASHTFTWLVTDAAAPGPGDPSTLVWMYHSHTDETRDTLAGLVGTIVVGRREDLRPDLTAADVDREVVLFFSVLDELHSLYAPDNLAAYLGVSNEEALAAGDPIYAEHYLRHSINGYLYCNSPAPLVFTRGQLVRFHVIALGTEVDMHTANVRKETMALDGQAAPVMDLVPGSMRTSDVRMLNAGSAIITCRIGDHIDAGMDAVFNVVEPEASAPAPAPESGPLRTYYVAAEPIAWDYAPAGADLCDGSPAGAAFTDAQLTYVGSSEHTVGRRYRKGVYRQYTDDTFTQAVPPPPGHGLLGPLLTANVGDRLRVVFKNGFEHLAVNWAPDGGLVLLSGPPPLDADDPAAPEVEAVAPGAVATYEYSVPESAGPGVDDLSTVAYVYTSSVNYDHHPPLGLVGAVVVGAPGTFPPLGAGPQVPPGVDGLVPLLFTIQDENSNPLLLQTLEDAGLVDSVDAPPGPAWAADFEESNRKHVVNGYLYCNMPRIEATLNQTLQFVLLSIGSEGDLHGPVFEGQLMRGGAGGVATAELLPAVTRVVEVTAAAPGTWRVYCATQNHVDAGMAALMHVQ